MQRLGIGATMCLVAFSVAGCASSADKERPIAGKQQRNDGNAKSESSVRTDAYRPAERGAARAVAYSAADNPTTRAGRGTPGLDDFLAPAAWVLVDGHEGRFMEREGRPQVQWVIEEPVSESPTFQGAVLDSLVGQPTDFACTLDMIEASGDATAAYAIKANDGAFRAGRSYSLLRPGADFVVRNRTTGDVVDEIAPLPPGTYLLVAKIANSKTGKEALAVTQFTVR